MAPKRPRVLDSAATNTETHCARNTPDTQFGLRLPLPARRLEAQIQPFQACVYSGEVHVEGCAGAGVLDNVASALDGSVS